MDFTPSRCPNPQCGQHRDPRPDFYQRHGSYRPQCRDENVPRFRCRTCGRGFSSQTFQVDFRDRRPDCNLTLLMLLAGGVGLRETARRVGINYRSVCGKQVKMAKLLARIAPGAAGEGATVTRLAHARWPLVRELLAQYRVVAARYEPEFAAPAPPRTRPPRAASRSPPPATQLAIAGVDPGSRG